MATVETFTNTNTISDSPHVPGPEGYESSSEAEDEQPSTSTGVPWHSQRLRQQLERYAAVRSISDGCQTASYLIPSVLTLVDLLMVVIVAPQLDTAVATSLVLLTMVGISNNGFSPFFHKDKAPETPDTVTHSVSSE